MKQVVVSLEVPDDQDAVFIQSALMHATDPSGCMEHWRLVGIVVHKPTAIFNGEVVRAMPKAEALNQLMAECKELDVTPWEVYVYEQLLERQRTMLDPNTVMLDEDRPTATLREELDDEIDLINDEELDTLREAAAYEIDSIINLAAEIMPEELDKQINAGDQHKG